ncbi:MAG TPA: metal ABC transporter ATP-binding protein [Acidobacteriota bacterium]|nr:metal ABC transporter ATP-binding protein [Acidobacteriota bacterium]
MSIMIKARNVSFSYGNVPVLSNVNFDINEGDFVAVLGPNGAGKSTLAKLMIGLEDMQNGILEINGSDVKKVQKNVIGYMPQRYSIDRLFPGTVQEILQSQNGDDIHLVPELDVKPLLKKKFVQLSGGQQQRVLITLALQNNPKILILDEPTVGVDVKTEKQFLALLRKLSTENKITILLITHDVGMVPTVTDKVLCINHNVCCIGESSQTKDLLKKVYGMHEEHHHHGHHHHD